MCSAFLWDSLGKAKQGTFNSNSIAHIELDN